MTEPTKLPPAYKETFVIATTADEAVAVTSMLLPVKKTAPSEGTVIATAGGTVRLKLMLPVAVTLPVRTPPT